MNKELSDQSVTGPKRTSNHSQERINQIYGPDLLHIHAILHDAPQTGLSSRRQSSALEGKTMAAWLPFSVAVAFFCCIALLRSYYEQLYSISLWCSPEEQCSEHLLDGSNVDVHDADVHCCAISAGCLAGGISAQCEQPRNDDRAVLNRAIFPDGLPAAT